jgi:hypothetical protein
MFTTEAGATTAHFYLTAAGSHVNVTVFHNPQI